MSGHWNPCDRAEIPFNGFKESLHLDSEERSNITTRSAHHNHIMTRERVIIKPGEEDGFYVDFDIKLSDDGLQDTVSIISDHNDVALIIDGSKFEDAPYDRECIVATTIVSVPETLYHLVLDVQNSGVGFENIKSTFKELDIYSKNGAVHIRDSNVGVQKLDVQMHNGALSTIQSTISAKTATIHGQNGRVSARFSGNPIESLDVESRNGAVELVVFDEDSASSDVTSKIKAKSQNGRVEIKTYVQGQLELEGSSRNGRVSTEVYGNIGGSIHAQTHIGHLQISGPIKVIESRKSITGTLIVGKYGEEEVSSIDLDVNAGALNLLVGPAQDGSRVEPSLIGDGETTPPGFGPPDHAQGVGAALPWLIGILAVSAVAFHVITRYRKSRGSGQVKI